MSIRARNWGASVGLALLLLAAYRVPAGRAQDESRQPAWLGVYSQELTSALREAIDYDGDGVLISKVIDDSPADKAGLKKGDVIVRVGGRSVNSAADLASAVRASRPGDTVALDVVRDGEHQTIRAQLSARTESEVAPTPETPDPPDAPEAPDTPVAPEAPKAHENGFDFNGNGDFNIQIPNDMLGTMGRGRLGVRIQDLDQELGDYFDVPDGKGVLITEVLKDTPAERAGLKSGDVITRVEDEKVSDSGDLLHVLGTQEGKTSITVTRHGSKKTVEVTLEKPQPRVMRLRSPNGMMRSNEADGMSSSDKAELKREMKELREELEDLRKDLEELRRK